MLVYEGPSFLDVTPIVAIVTGVDKPSQNPKTGNMLQLWILPAGDEPPGEAARLGKDRSVCGNCRHRPVNDNSCYVQMTGPASVYRKYKKGGYRAPSIGLRQEIFTGRSIRLGAYGDPVALPPGLVHTLATECAGHTGYTHQWRTEKGRQFRDILMASVDTPEEMLEAHVAGWRTFRVLASGEAPDEDVEVFCSTVGNELMTCEKCLLCRGGTGPHSVAIPVHGARSSNFRSGEEWTHTE